jgi:hypothetical protein
MFEPSLPRTNGVATEIQKGRAHTAYRDSAPIRRFPLVRKFNSKISGINQVSRRNTIVDNAGNVKAAGRSEDLCRYYDRV